MDDKTWIGACAESAIIADLTKKKYDIFISATGKSECDLISVKDNKINRIQVKGCNSKSRTGSYSVQLRSIRSNKTSNIIKKFDASKSDILAIYIIPLDKIFYFDSLNLDGKNVLTISQEGQPFGVATRLESG